ncbi:MAG: carboxypeptidase-like regulatory domain-containing protein, partial [Flavobacteriia bacterium]|nr:carboxypeptidase-like regulatory domain-containing protein [Flavobacteriia bacterium]
MPGGLRGNVQEYGSQMPLEYALVVVNADAKEGLTQALSAYTNSDGYFQINGIPAGTYEVTVKMAGFKDMKRSISVKAGRIGFERFLLEESTVVLEDVVIDVKRQEQQTKVATAVVQLSPKSITTFSIGGEPDLMR